MSVVLRIHHPQKPVIFVFVVLICLVFFFFFTSSTESNCAHARARALSFFLLIIVIYLDCYCILPFIDTVNNSWNSHTFFYFLITFLKKETMYLSLLYISFICIIPIDIYKKLSPIQTILLYTFSKRR